MKKGSFVDLTVYDEAAWRKSASDEHYWLCYWSHFLPDQAVWKEELPLTSVVDTSKLKKHLVKGVRARLDKNWKTIQKVKKLKPDLARRKWGHVLQMISGTRSILLYGGLFLDSMKEWRYQFEFASESEWEGLVTEQFAALKTAGASQKKKKKPRGNGKKKTRTSKEKAEDDVKEITSQRLIPDYDYSRLSCQQTA